MLVLECGINHLEFKLTLCLFLNLVLPSIIKELWFSICEDKSGYKTKCRRESVCMILSITNLSLSFSWLHFISCAILASEPLIYMYEQFLTWAASPLASGNDCIWNKYKIHSLLQTNLGSFVNTLHFSRTQDTVFSGQILISLLNEQFSLQQGPNPKVEGSSSDKSSRIWSLFGSYCARCELQ